MLTPALLTRVSRPAEARDGLGDDARRSIGGGHVAVQGHGVGAERAELLDQPVQRWRRIEIHRRDPRRAIACLRVARQTQTGRPSDSTRGSDHQGMHRCASTARPV
jgi:hypothetical protein